MPCGGGEIIQSKYKVEENVNMKYDFTSIIDRHDMDAIAVDGLGTSTMSPAKPKDGFDIIPMWVADMNFPTVPTIPEAIIERAKHPAYDYRLLGKQAVAVG